MFLTFVEDRIRLGPAQGVGTIPVVDISIDGILKRFVLTQVPSRVSFFQN